MREREREIEESALLVCSARGLPFRTLHVKDLLVLSGPDRAEDFSASSLARKEDFSLPAFPRLQWWQANIESFLITAVCEQQNSEEQCEAWGKGGGGRWGDIGPNRGRGGIGGGTHRSQGYSQNRGANTSNRVSTTQQQRM